MNTDTQRKVEEIKNKGWYYTFDTLGEGGWTAVRKFASGWKTYELTIRDGLTSTHTIIARDDQTAKDAFHQLFNLQSVEYDTKQKKTIYRLIETSD